MTTEPTGNSGSLLPCPLCGGKGIQHAKDSGPVECLKCCFSLTKQVWQSLPRRDNAQAEVVREMREHISWYDRHDEYNGHPITLPGKTEHAIEDWADALESSAGGTGDCTNCDPQGNDCFACKPHEYHAPEPGTAPRDAEKLAKEMCSSALGNVDSYERQIVRDWASRVRRLSPSPGPAPTSVYLVGKGPALGRRVSDFIEGVYANKDEANNAGMFIEAPVHGAPEPECGECHPDTMTCDCGPCEYERKGLRRQCDILNETIARMRRERDEREKVFDEFTARLERDAVEWDQLRTALADKEKECSGDFGGHLFRRETGEYGVAARDCGIEVLCDGEFIFSSKGAGPDQSKHTLEGAAQGEPGETIADKQCPFCGVDLNIHHGDDEPGQVSILSHGPSPVLDNKNETIARLRRERDEAELKIIDMDSALADKERECERLKGELLTELSKAGKTRVVLMDDRPDWQGDDNEQRAEWRGLNLRVYWSECSDAGIHTYRWAVKDEHCYMIGCGWKDSDTRRVGMLYSQRLAEGAARDYLEDNNETTGRSNNRVRGNVDRAGADVHPAGDDDGNGTDNGCCRGGTGVADDAGADVAKHLERARGAVSEYQLTARGDPRYAASALVGAVHNTIQAIDALSKQSKK